MMDLNPPMMVVRLLLLARLCASSLVQQSVEVNLPSSQSGETDDHLARILRSSLDVSPIAQPCYTSPKDPKCSAIQKVKTNTYWISDQPGGYYYGNWASCQATGESCAIPLNNSVAIPSTATCNQGNVPKTLVNVTEPLDIVAAFTVNKGTKVPFVIKNTGHDWRGRSGAPNSFGLWMHNYRSPTVEMVLDRKFKPVGSPANRKAETVVRFGAGEQWAALYDFAEKQGLAVVGGTCPTVGVAGWLHGGGHSPLTPWYGMGVDNVRQITIITPDLQYLNASEFQNPDLFFAVRGGGGSTFGVVTDIVYKVVPKFAVQELTANLSSLSSAATKEFFNILTSNATFWAQKGWGGYIKTQTSLELINANSTSSAAASDMKYLISLFQRQKITYVLKTQPSWYAYYNQSLKPPSAHIGQWSGAVASRLVTLDVFSSEAQQNLTKILLDLHNQNLNLWLMLVTPTRFNQMVPSALHPSWATAVWSVRIFDKWDQFGNKPTDYRAHFVRTHAAIEPLRQLTPDAGVSISEAHIWEPWHAQVFWGRFNYEKLYMIKDRVDSDNQLTTYQAIKYEKGAPRYKCYPKEDESKSWDVNWNMEL